MKPDTRHQTTAAGSRKPALCLLLSALCLLDSAAQPMPPGFKPPLHHVTRAAQTFVGAPMAVNLVTPPMPDVSVEFKPCASTNGWRGLYPLFTFSPAVLQRFNSNIVFTVECSRTLQPWNMAARWPMMTNRSGTAGVSPVGWGLPMDDKMFYQVKILQ